MSKINWAELWTTINSNIFLFSLTIAVLLPFAVILVGYAIHMLGLTLAQLADLFIDSWIVYAIINYLFFPGVMLHETAHALFAVLTGAKVTELALFKRDGDSLGHVNFRHRGGPILVAVQRIFISSAPMFVGAAVVFGCQHVVFHMATAPLWLKILAGYIGISMFFHMTMSPQDIKVYVKGIPVFILILFIEMLLLRFFHII